MCKVGRFKLFDSEKLNFETEIMLCVLARIWVRYRLILQSIQHESCSFMGLDYAYEFSAQLVKYNFIYGLFSTNTPVLDSLFVAIISCGFWTILEMCSTWKLYITYWNRYWLNFMNFGTLDYEICMLAFQRLNFPVSRRLKLWLELWLELRKI